MAKFGAETSNDLTLPGTGSQEVKDLLEDRFPPQQNGTNPIVFDVTTGKLTDEANKKAINESIKAMAKAPARLQRHQPDQQRRPDGRPAVEGRPDRLRARPARHRLR